jgi:pimeloyl-ACP methyl ester carboxylesterase
VKTISRLTSYLFGAALILTAPSYAQTTPAATRSGIEEFESAGRGRLIVFLDGVGPDLESTWRNNSTASLFPALMLEDTVLHDFDIFVAGVRAARWDSSMTVESVVEGTYERLSQTGAFNRYHEIILIGHGIGGVVAEGILGRLQSDRVPDLGHIKAVLLLSTPSAGSNVSDLGRWIAQVPELRGLRASDLGASLQRFQSQVATIQRQSRQSDALKLQLFAAYDAPANSPDVSPDVSTDVYAHVAADTRIQAINIDFGGIAKPASPSAEIFTWTRERIEDVVAREKAGVRH